MSLPPARRRRLAMTKAQALVEAGLADDIDDARAQLEDMGEADEDVPTWRGPSAWRSPSELIDV
jgi:hypothetical protein